MGVALVVVCWYFVSSGTFVALVQNKPVLSLPLALVHGVKAASSSPGERVLGKPALGASFVERVLSAYHSPAVGTAEALYALSLRYDIDDAYALAFFLHESRFGTVGVARLTRSLGNIRCTAGYSCIAGYRAYASWQAGYQDWYQLIKEGYVGGQVSPQCPCVTVEQIVPVYAPAADGNDVLGYTKAVLTAVATWRRGRVVV